MRGVDGTGCKGMIWVREKVGSQGGDAREG